MPFGLTHPEDIAATAVELNDEGFFAHPEQWTEDMAPELAPAAGPPLERRSHEPRRAGHPASHQ
ncbi:MAG TPA: hypothetical protein VGP90_03230 [Acidimicrobiia bacterium]|nr:hypothetical protein [Acidimicrobiia bacterium]